MDKAAPSKTKTVAARSKKRSLKSNLTEVKKHPHYKMLATIRGTKVAKKAAREQAQSMPGRPI